MKMWIVLCQAITFAILLAQYQFFNEVEAEEHHTLSAGNWFGDLEKKLNVIKGVMHDVFESIKQSGHNMPLRVSPHRRLTDTIQDVSTTADPMTEDIAFGTNNEDFVIGTNYEDTYSNVTLDNSKILMPFDTTYGDQYASDLSEENSLSYQSEQTKGPHHHHKKKKKVKRNKKKLKPKRKVKPKKLHVEKKSIEKARLEKAREKRLRVEKARVEKARVEKARVEKARVEKARVEKARVEKARVEKARVEKAQVEKAHTDKVLEGNLAEDKPKPTSRVEKIRPRKKKASKFVKTTVDNKFNDSESNESTRKGKPVDIIVHIKMNE